MYEARGMYLVCVGYVVGGTCVGSVWEVRRGYFMFNLIAMYLVCGRCVVVGSGWVCIV